jgi:predicted ATPase
VQLKGFSEPIRVIHVLPQADLPENFPPLVSLVAKPSNLPLQTTPFIGRSREIEQISQLTLREDVRLLTLAGAGGTGKTRLALQVGGAVLDRFERGVFFVNLAPLTDPAIVASTIASTLKVKEVPGEEILTTLIAYLKDREMLLILDNFEHLVTAAHVVHQLLVFCPHLKILVTSRIPLHLSSEHEYQVPPLAVPDLAHLPDLQELTQYDAVTLFIERASAIKPDFTVTNDNAPAVAEICSRLDGLPLAIELAAARIKLFPPPALLRRLSSRLTLLTGGAKDRPSRQQTLRNTIEWSYSLLPKEEQDLFARLSVFVGGCTFAAAEAVCNPESDLDLLEGMASLVDKSLLRQDGDEEPRFTMLETIREYAAGTLRERGQREWFHTVHATYFLRLTEEVDPSRDRERGEQWLERVVAEQDNVRAALDWLLDDGRAEEAARLATALWFFWSTQGLFHEARQRLEAVLAQPGVSARIRSTALLKLCHFAFHQGALAAVEEAASEARELARSIGDIGTEFEAVANLASVALQRGDREAARALGDECSRLADQTGERTHTAEVLRMQGFAAAENGDFERAGQLFSEEAILRRDPAIGGDLAGALINVGWAALQRGDLVEADAAYAESLVIAGERSQGTVSRLGLAAVALERGEIDAAAHQFGELLSYSLEGGFLPMACSCLEGIAQIAAVRGRWTLAALLMGATGALYEDMGRPQQRSARRQQRLDLARSAMGEAAWATTYEQGRALSPDDAVHLAQQYADTGNQEEVKDPHL